MASKKNLVYKDLFTAQRKMDIKKGDTVLIIAGKDKGKRGVVLEVRPRENRLVLENLNMVTKHEKQRNRKPGDHKEGRYETPAPIDRSNVMLVDPNTGDPMKIGHKEVDGKFVRTNRKSGEIVDA
jgi:large subunit ribosomal protein L24